MSFYVNNTELNAINFNGEQVKSVYYNNRFVWGMKPWKGWNNATWADLYDLCQAKQKGVTDWPADVVLGKTKTLNFTSPFDGKTTKADFMIIGLDIDAPGTMTFHSKNTIGSPVVHLTGVDNYGQFGTAAEACEEFYEKCGIQDYIRTVRKGTCETRNSSRQAPVVYKDYKIWLPSEFEMGMDKFSTRSVAWSAPTNAETTYGVNVPYPYYYDISIFGTSKYSPRINKGADTEFWTNGFNGLTPYWTRSLSYLAEDEAVLIGQKTGMYFPEDVPESGYINAENFFAPAFVIG